MLLQLLSFEYPNPASELNFSNDYELVVSVVLSAQCTDKKVNEVTERLFKRFKNFQELAQADINDIEEIIRQVNYYKTKAKNIRELAEIVTTTHGGRLPDLINELMTLPGVGRKTANVVASERGSEPGLAVDTHVFRVSKRLGLTSGETPTQVEEELRASFKSDDWRTLHHCLILHGRRICKARSPLCKECSLTEICRNAPRS
jgi:endonuclease-3